MNVIELFDRIIVYKQGLSFNERENIVDYVMDLTKNLPIRKPFVKEQLLNFVDYDLIMYLVDVTQLYGVKYFYDINKQI